ncbi:MAG TPA: class I SAM-dependent methyltransferase, partial [Acidobacteriota bacterium]|nr:class I SAM-dependent methyltransferase [Acidobacteriota bacterium]
MSFQCVLCNAKSSTKFFEKSHYPVQDGLIYESAEKARQAPTGKIELHFCTACGFIWNATFEENKIRYDAAYEISLAASQVYRHFLQETSRRLAERYLTNTSHAIEIGCGDGSFLETLCSIANCTGTGFDPTFRSQHSSNGKVRFFRSFLPDSESLNHADLICCRHVLQQVLKPSSPVTFLNSIRDRIKDRSNIKLYFEVPNAAFIFTPENIWNIVYEYHSYFTQESLRNLFSSNGF